MKNCKFFLILMLTISITCGLFANGLSLNGVGSKASGMGTAFIGLADDFSAVFFNPAGLTQIEKSEFSFFGTSIFPTGTYNFELMGTTMADTISIDTGYPSGAISYYKPVSDTLVIGIAGYVPAGVGQKWSGDELAMLSGGSPYIWDSKLFMITVSPVAALKVSDRFSIGFSLNINYVSLEMQRPAGGEANIPFFQYKESMSGIAIGANLGLMYKVNDKLSIGMVYKLPVKATLNGSANSPFLGLLGSATESEGERTANWPMLAGIGIALRANDNLTITADLIYTNWKKLEDIPVVFDDPSWKSLEEASKFILRWEDTFDVKLGMQYKLSESFYLRAGFYTDKAPSPAETLNIMLPNISYNAVTGGLGYKKGKISLDIAVEYLIGTDREVDPMNYLVGTGMPGTHGMKMLVPNATFSIKF